ncbi:shikimate dehydrogenase family protein [Taibaiella soli]|uniref:Shikimate dehydrogenase n=1 Tax=Taibaiella soli TaxID=1649169 RepID=A0A2W2ACS2_9BACT|nr:shikimate dehydrogenase [Taibaiella soli]PZF73101.1 shikimate dehydrogenase [Taibaiella soli]
MTDVYGLIGYPLTHSFSAGYFSEKFSAGSINAVYQNFPLEDITQFPGLLQRQPYLKGLNVTIPHKQAIIPYLDALSKEAAQIGAVNCISFSEGKLTGHNTDIIGFRESLRPLLQPQHQKALILGTGGASLAVAYALDQLNIPYLKVSRQVSSSAISYGNISPQIVAEHMIIINTTPLGTYPSVHSFPDFPYKLLSQQHLLYDLVYNPAETAFLTLGKQQGAIIKNGLEMLHLQAEAAWQIWQQYSF